MRKRGIIHSGLEKVVWLSREQRSRKLFTFLAFGVFISFGVAMYEVWVRHDDKLGLILVGVQITFLAILLSIQLFRWWWNESGY